MDSPKREQDVVITNQVLLNAMPLPESAFDNALEDEGTQGPKKDYCIIAGLLRSLWVCVVVCVVLCQCRDGEQL